MYSSGVKMVDDKDREAMIADFRKRWGKIADKDEKEPRKPPAPERPAPRESSIPKADDLLSSLRKKYGIDDKEGAEKPTGTQQKIRSDLEGLRRGLEGRGTGAPDTGKDQEFDIYYEEGVRQFNSGN